MNFPDRLLDEGAKMTINLARKTNKAYAICMKKLIVGGFFAMVAVVLSSNFSLLRAEQKSSEVMLYGHGAVKCASFIEFLKIDYKKTSGQYVAWIHGYITGIGEGYTLWNSVEADAEYHLSFIENFCKSNPEKLWRKSFHFY